MATPLAGGVAGAWSVRWHWWAGAAGVGLAWAAAAVYTAAVAPGSFRVLLDTLGALAGHVPGAVFVALPVLVGSLLGALGGGIGRQLRLLWTADA
jgi:putative Mn2+ efflux pump MntP